MDSSRQAEGREWSGGDGSGREWRGGKGRAGQGRAGQGRVPDCLGGLSRVGISSRSTRPWNGQPPSIHLYVYYLCTQCTHGQTHLRMHTPTNHSCTYAFTHTHTHARTCAHYPILIRMHPYMQSHAHSCSHIYAQF